MFQIFGFFGFFRTGLHTPTRARIALHQNTSQPFFAPEQIDEPTVHCWIWNETEYICVPQDLIYDDLDAEDSY